MLIQLKEGFLKIIIISSKFKKIKHHIELVTLVDSLWHWMARSLRSKMDLCTVNSELCKSKRYSSTQQRNLRKSFRFVSFFTMNDWYSVTCVAPAFPGYDNSTMTNGNSPVTLYYSQNRQQVTTQSIKHRHFSNDV